ncbi:ABC transporter ATP-binding protein, partial [Mesorhizobium sp. M2A.F.Ca.ET.067.02.1.1]
MALEPPSLACRPSPPQGGDQMSRMLSPIFNAAGGGAASELPISPLEGEMSGRTERGASRPTY